MFGHTNILESFYKEVLRESFATRTPTKNYKVFLGGISADGEISPKSYWGNTEDHDKHKCFSYYSFRYVPDLKTLYWWDFSRKGESIPQNIQDIVKDKIESWGFEVERIKNLGSSCTSTTTVQKVNRFRSHGYTGAGLTS